MYVSTDLLPQNQPNSKKYFIAKLYDKFQNPQQVLDFVVFHELGHLVFNNSFSGLIDFNSELLKTRNGIDRFKSWFKEDYKDLPLYQMNRSLEEHFADSFSAIILSKRYEVLPEEYIKVRNGNDSLGLTRTKGFDININRLNDTFKKLKEINDEEDEIDIVIQKLLKLNGTKNKDLISSENFVSIIFACNREHWNVVHFLLNQINYNLEPNFYKIINRDLKFFTDISKQNKLQKIILDHKQY